MYKLYFELSRFDDAGQVIHTDSYLISLDERGLFSRLVIAPLKKLFEKWSIL